MKKVLVCTIGFGVMVLMATLLAEEPRAGFVDFGKLPTTSGGEFVEVNLGRTVFAISGKLFEKSDPDFAKLVRGLELLQVNVVGLGDDGPAGLGVGKKPDAGPGPRHRGTAARACSRCSILVRSPRPLATRFT